MDYRGITSLALRITGIVMLAQTLPYAPNVFRTFFAGDRTFAQAMVLTIAAELLPLVVGLALLYFPARIGDKLSRTAPSEDAQAQTARIGEIAFMALGIYFFMQGLFTLAWYGGKYFVYRQVVTGQGYDDAGVLPDDVAGLFSAVTEIVFGFVLTFGARGLYRFVRRMRETRPKADVR